MGEESARGESGRVFLSAEWRDLVMLNYEVDPALLKPFVPDGTELDSFQGKTYLSMVGFRFCRTRLFGGIAVPFHTNFDEVNLRFYVRRTLSGETRRGVVFIAEIVPRLAIASIANFIYGEKYQCLPMEHDIADSGTRRSYEYRWRMGTEWCRLTASTEGTPNFPVDGSLEQFISEHYWGYSKAARRSVEYRVTHVPWRVWNSDSACLQGNVDSLYGAELATVVRAKPACAFVAEGSSVAVFRHRQLS